MKPPGRSDPVGNSVNAGFSPAEILHRLALGSIMYDMWQYFQAVAVRYELTRHLFGNWSRWTEGGKENYLIRLILHYQYSISHADDYIGMAGAPHR